MEGAGAGDENASKNCEETSKESVSSTKKEEKSPEVCQSEKEVKESCPEGAEKMEDSPVLGLMTGQKTTKSKAEETQSDGNKEVPSESTIKKAIRKRATYVKANSEYATSSIELSLTVLLCTEWSKYIVHVFFFLIFFHVLVIYLNFCRNHFFFQFIFLDSRLLNREILTRASFQESDNGWASSTFGRGS